MILLSLDEYGAFERKDFNNDAVFIGGILYNDKGVAGDIDEEKKRIEAYYKSVCKAANKNGSISYPMGLHVSKQGANGAMVGQEKELVKQTLGEFLKNGTFNGTKLRTTSNGASKNLPNRHGEYYIYLILKSDEGKADRLRANASNWVKDDYASNLYFHMASEAIHRAVFQNPLLNKNEQFNLMIASRSSENYEKTSAISAELVNQGYKEMNVRKTSKDSNANAGNKVFYNLTNSDVYRTIVEQYLVENNPNNSSIENCEVKSIDYNNSKDMEFLYLADSVCSFFSHKLKSDVRKNAESWFKEIQERATRLLDHDKLLLFAYDSEDMEFSKAFDEYKKGNYFEALCSVYDARGRKGEINKYYRDNWFTYIQKQIAQSCGYEEYERAVRHLRKMLLINNYDQNKGLFIGKALVELDSIVLEQVTNSDKYDVFYHLYEALMMIYNHIGNSEEAAYYFSKAQKYASSISLDEYLATRNRMIVYMLDSFKTEEAYELSLADMDYAQSLAELKNKIHGAGCVGGNQLRYKSLSQHGEVCATLRKSDAEKYFLHALKVIDERTPDYYITESYLIQHLMDMREEKKYYSYIKDYLGQETDKEKQFDYIIEISKNPDSLINPKFAFYVYVKGLYLFEMDKVTDQLMEKLKSISVGGHPAEIIYKYLTLIAIKVGDKKSANYFKDKLVNSTREDSMQSPLLKSIWYLSMIEIAEAKGKKGYETKHFVELIKVLEDTFIAFADLSKEESPVKQLELIREKFTFMYY